MVAVKWQVIFLVSAVAFYESRLFYRQYMLDESFQVYQDCSDSEASLKVMSFNIRGENLDLDSKYNNWWKSRNVRAAQIVAKYEPDFIGVQEGSDRQIRDLISQYEKLAPNRSSFVHLGHTDQSGIWVPNAIIYNSKRFNHLEGGSFWLSATPDVPHSATWAHLQRSAFWARFQDVKYNRSFAVVNTHLDHLSETARQRGAEIIKNRINRLRQRFPQDSIILVGDFNCAPGMPAYEILASGEDVLDLWTAALHNNAAPVSFHNWWGFWVLSPLGSFGTGSFLIYWTGGHIPTHFNRYHIDWILLFPGKSKLQLEPRVALVATDLFVSQKREAMYPSGTLFPSFHENHVADAHFLNKDHYPVVSCLLSNRR